MSASSPTCKCRQGMCYDCNKCKRCGCTCPVIQRKSHRTGAREFKSHDDVIIDEIEEAAPLKTPSRKRKRNDVLPLAPRKSPPKAAKRKVLLSMSSIEKASRAVISSKTVAGSKIVEKGPLKTIGDVCIAFNFQKHEGRNLPSYSDRKDKKFIDFEIGPRRRLMHFASSSLSALLRMILPVDAKGSLSEVVRKSADDSSHSEDRMFRDNVIELKEKLPQCCLQRIVLESVLSKSHRSEFLQKHCKIGKKKATQSRKNYVHMTTEGKQLIDPIRHIKRHDSLTVKRAVSFVLNENNIQRTSWGTKVIQIDGEEKHLPKLIRKK